jgi:hypothetical protein
VDVGDTESSLHKVDPCGLHPSLECLEYNMMGQPMGMGTTNADAEMKAVHVSVLGK